MTRSTVHFLMAGLAVLCGPVGLAQAESVRYLSGASEPFDRRMIAEIESVGLAVEKPATELEPFPPGTVALIRVVAQPPTIELWLVRGQTVELAATVPRDPSLAEEQDTISVAEAVRAFLAPLAEKPAVVAGPLPAPPPVVPEPAPALVTPSPQVEPVPAPRPEPSTPRSFGDRDLAVGLALAGMPQPGGLGFSGMAVGRARLLSVVWVELGGSWPVAHSTIQRSAASADVDARLAFAGASWEFQDAVGFPLRAGAGTTLVHLEARGEAPAPRPTKRDSVFVLVPHLSLGVELPFTSALALDAGARLGYAASRADVAFGSDVVGTFGHPFFVAHLGASFRP